MIEDYNVCSHGVTRSTETENLQALQNWATQTWPKLDKFMICKGTTSKGQRSQIIIWVMEAEIFDFYRIFREDAQFLSPKRLFGCLHLNGRAITDGHSLHPYSLIFILSSWPRAFAPIIWSNLFICSIQRIRLLHRSEVLNQSWTPFENLQNQEKQARVTHWSDSIYGSPTNFFVFKNSFSASLSKRKLDKLFDSGRSPILYLPLGSCQVNTLLGHN